MHQILIEQFSLDILAQQVLEILDKATERTCLLTTFALQFPTICNQPHSGFRSELFLPLGRNLNHKSNCLQEASIFLPAGLDSYYQLQPTFPLLKNLPCNTNTAHQNYFAIGAESRVWRLPVSSCNSSHSLD